MSIRVYKVGSDYQPGFAAYDENGWYREVGDEEFEKLKSEGSVFEKDGVFYFKLSDSENRSSAGSKIKGFFANPFENPGATIKKLAKIVFYIGLAATFIYGIIIGIQTGEITYSYISGYSKGFSVGAMLVVWIGGAIGSYLSCLGLAALGDIVVNLNEINKKIK